ncbi:hypothetical protein TSH7_25150 [Azospirillum sp. TSH7]|uniref:hypothetical protein n=1 Tax=unclassified Azospirillum TaxID=2630922 RepID=UPI000D622DA0|nr:MULTISPECIES: hypothetical protein [unclassified Azospirillum]PWC57834.1 hypothetical protein TSH7_25150 [Azospirillum sp. TSH7]PWC70253.1 hypothetical protein TSH20_07190 [Azospirillum sp. TSH20]
MTADLLERARSASSLEECDVIDDGLQVLSRGKLNEIYALYDLIDNVRVGRLPRPVLLGVVAALVPEGWRWVKTSTGTGPDESRRIGVYMPARHDKEMHSEVLWADGATDALALLIAILEATHE